MNPHLTQDHLTQTQIDEYLIEPQPALAGHLASCPQCSFEVTRFQSVLIAFDRETLAWAEARSATLPSPAAKPLAGFWRPLAWSATAIACAAIAFSTMHNPYAGVPPARQNASQIASDNQLLANIDQAVDAPVASPAGLFDVPNPSSAAAR